jgi:hypothetical protein
MNGKRTFERTYHWVAAGGPLLFFAVATVLGFVRAGYDPIAQPISALAVGPGGWIQGVNFALLAVSFLSMAVVLRKPFSAGPASLAGPGLFALMTVGVGLAGIFPMDAPGAPPTLVGRLHGMAGLLVFPWIPIVLLLVARRFRADSRWRPYFRYTVATGLLCLALFVFFLIFVGPPTSTPRPFSGFRGLVQRLLLLPFFTWCALIASRAFRRASVESRAPALSPT